MNYLAICLLFVCMGLVVALTLKRNKISELETRILLLEGERENLTLKVNLLSKGLLKATETKEEVKTIEEEKDKKKGSRKQPPDTGDSSSRLDRLNGLSDK